MKDFLHDNLMGSSGGVDSYFKTVPTLLSMPGGNPKNTREKLTSSLTEFPITPTRDDLKHMTNRFVNKAPSPFRQEAPEELIPSSSLKSNLVLCGLILLFLCIVKSFVWPSSRMSKVQQPVYHKESSRIQKLENEFSQVLTHFKNWNQTSVKSISDQATILTEESGKKMANLEKRIMNQMSQNNDIFTQKMETLLNQHHTTIQSRLSENDVMYSDFTKRLSIAEKLVSSFEKKLDDQVKDLKKLFGNHVASTQSEIDKQNQAIEAQKETKKYKNSDIKELADGSSFVSAFKALEGQVNSLRDRVIYDTTRQIDWASSYLGAMIIHQFTSEGYGRTKWCFLQAFFSRTFSKYLFKAPLISKPAEVVLGGSVIPTSFFQTGTNSLLPGNCFAFSGSKGNITVGLPAMVNVDEVHVDHVTSTLLPFNSTAPYRFKVYIDDVKQDLTKPPSKCVGEFEFQFPALDSQTFPIIKSNDDHYNSRRVRFEFSQNHGGKHTCIYRLRVHGKVKAA